MGRGQITIKVFGHDGRGWSIDQDRANVADLLSGFGYELSPSIVRASHVYCVWLDLLMHPRHFWVVLFCKIFRKKLVAVATNDLSGDPKKIAFVKRHIDVCVAPSQRIAQVLATHGIKTVRIPFYVRPDIFRKLDATKEALVAELGIDYRQLAGRTIIGSFQRDSLGSDLTRQKWQKNPEHLIQILKRLPPNRFVLLLAGPRRHYLIRRCREENLPVVFVGDIGPVQRMEDDISINNLPLATINQLYNLVDVYLVTSKSEGGPKAVLEAASAGTLVISSDVGLARDILHKDLVFAVDDLEAPVRLLHDYFSNPQAFNSHLAYNMERVGQELSPDTLRTKFSEPLSL